MLITYLISFYTFLHAHTIINTYMSRCVCKCTCIRGFSVLACLQHLCMFAQSSPILSDPMDCSPPGSSLHGISRQEYWSELPFLPPGYLPDPGSNPHLLSLLHWQADSLPTVSPVLQRWGHITCTFPLLPLSHLALFLEYPCLVGIWEMKLHQWGT